MWLEGAQLVGDGLTKSGTEGSQRTLTIADESLRSIPLRVSSSRVEHLGGSVGSIVVVKGQTGAYFGAPKLRAFAENVDIDPDLPEAQELRTHWQHVRREDVHPCLPILKFTPIASLGTEAAAKSEVDLLVIAVSIEPPISFVSQGGKAQRRVNMVVCDASGDALPLTCFCPAEGALPALAPGVLLAIGGARVRSLPHTCCTCSAIVHGQPRRTRRGVSCGSGRSASVSAPRVHTMWLMLRA